MTAQAASGTAAMHPGYGPGKAGWVTARFDTDETVPFDLIAA